MRNKHFNSIKVRLEQSVVNLDLGKATFQFHKGAIRTVTNLPSGFAQGLFQFHKGAIRTDLCPGFDWFGSISIP